MDITIPGAVLNAVTVLAGGAVGLLLKGRMPEAIAANCMRALGLVVCVIGVAGALEGDPMLLVVSIALGCITGEALGIEKGLNTLGEALQNKFARNAVGGTSGSDTANAGIPQTEEEAYASGGARQSAQGEALPKDAAFRVSQRSPRHNATFAEGFITATLLFCVGAMTVVGSIESGLTGDKSLILTKSILDCIGAMILASAFGPGVLFAAAAILLYQGGIEFFAGYLQDVLTEPLITQVSAVGSVMILGLGLNMVFSAGIRAANLLPGLLFAAGYFWLFM